jgi:glucose/arabinose dehydrogenase
MRFSWLFFVAGLVALVSAPAMAQQNMLPLQEGVPLNANVFAEGLNFPVGMVVLPDGSLLVGSSNPTAGSYFSSTGELLRLTDLDGDGVADGEPTVVAADLAGMVTAVAVQGDLVFVTSVESGRERIQILRATEDWSESYAALGEITFAFRSFAHQSYGLATRPSPVDSNLIELYFNVGASGNDTDGRYVTVGGLLDASLIDSSIYMTEVSDDGVTLLLSEPVQIATGLRNAMAFGFHPETGDLWITDNGIDGLEDVWASYSADELNVIAASDIGGATVDFGFPSTFTVYDTGEVVGSDGVQPVVAFVPIDGMENEGVASMVFTPASFAPVMGSGVMVGFHGQYDQWGPDNEENALLFVDLDSLDVSIVVPSGSPGVGHLDSLAASDDAIYVADMCVGDSLAHATPCGVIYRLTPA